VTGTTSSTAGLSWTAAADADTTCCTYRVLADGAPASVQSTGPLSATVLRLSAGTEHSFAVVAVDPSGNVSAPSAAVSATTLSTVDTTAPTAPANLSASDFGCETWLSWQRSTDDIDPQAAIRYEVFVNGVSDGSALDVDRWITYGTQSTNTYTVQAEDSAGNRSVSSVVLTNQSC
jgi:chitinase